MNKLRIAFVLALLLGLFVVGTASALEIVSYEDTGADNTVKDWSEAGESSLMCNGNFDAETWVEGEDGTFPLCWNVWEDSKSGWESAHLAQMNYAAIGDTAEEFPMDDAMGIFVRNVGGKGPFYAGASTALDQVAALGSNYYWVEVQATMWGGYPQIQFNNSILTFKDGMYGNSVAFYGFGTSEDPDTVGEWRELFHDEYDYGEPGIVPCANPWEECIQVGRYETVWIDAEEGTPYLHIMAGQKFDTNNVWTVFGFDNILVVETNAEVEDFSGWWNVGDTTWDEEAAR